ncbi:MAG: 50S ribosome-binding GTPase [Verrucomicrobia bacterium]|nr:50S ribosome-binding GTPase [Verrucomicrobiota bacterium]
MNPATATTAVQAAPKEACASCSVYRSANLKKLGLNMERWDYVVALAGNPNTGKSTVFNSLTGLRQHTGNWPGKTVARAEGGFDYAGKRFKLVDLPGTYSLLSTSPDEEIARNFILFGQPDVTIVVADATRLERNLNLVLQVLEITGRAVLCLNLVDEAKRHGIAVDDRQLARDLGVPVVPTAARSGEGLPALLEAVSAVAAGARPTRPHRLSTEPAALKGPLNELCAKIAAAYPAVPNPRWVAMRLLGGDDEIAHALRTGDLLRLNEARVAQTA